MRTYVHACLCINSISHTVLAYIKNAYNFMSLKIFWEPLRAPRVLAAGDIQKYAHLKHPKILRLSFLMERTALNVIEREWRDQSGDFTMEDYKCVGCKLFWRCCWSQRQLQKDKSTYTHKHTHKCAAKCKQKLLWPLLFFEILILFILIHLGLISLDKNLCSGTVLFWDHTPLLLVYRNIPFVFFPSSSVSLLPSWFW